MDSSLQKSVHQGNVPESRETLEAGCSVTQPMVRTTLPDKVALKKRSINNRKALKVGISRSAGFHGRSRPFVAAGSCERKNSAQKGAVRVLLPPRACALGGMRLAVNGSSLEAHRQICASALLCDCLYHVAGLEAASCNCGGNRRDVVNIGHANDANLTGHAADHLSG